MREKKFRAWDKLDKKFLWPWPEGFSILGEVTCFDLIGQQICKNMYDRKTSLERMNDIEITQYIGLKDKNGKKIYERDICSFYYIDKFDFFQGYIIYNDECAAFFFRTEVCEVCADIYLYECDEIEIIGNVYENPELLKEN